MFTTDRHWTILQENKSSSQPHIFASSFISYFPLLYIYIKNDIFLSGLLIKMLQLYYVSASTCMLHVPPILTSLISSPFYTLIKDKNYEAIQRSPLSCYLFFMLSKCSLQSFVLKTPSNL